VILLNKMDLHDDVSDFVERTQAIAPGVPVLAVSAKEGWGIEAIAASLRRGETGALVGSSGAGKSTLLNLLLGDGRQRTQAVRESDQRGRHTTTNRELIEMPGHWWMIDMPGLRELGIWADPERIDDAFVEIGELAQQCRYRDCRHQNEPGCAVLAAGIAPERLRSYAKLRREVEHLDRKRDVNAALEQKRKWKSIHKAMRNYQKRT